MRSKKQQALATALQLFVENGYENTPTALISKQSGVATGTLFHHFKSKQDILNQLYLDSKHSLRKNLLQNLNSSKREKNQIYIIWLNYMHWATQNPLYFRFLEKYSEHSLITCESRSQVDNTYKELFCILRKTQENQQLGKLPWDYILMLTEMHFTTAAKYCVANPNTLEKKKLPKRLFLAYWKAISD